jgi:hypothetical protein
LNGTHQLVCATDINVLGRNINTIKGQTKALLGSSKEVDLEINTVNARHDTFMSHHQNAEQSPNIKIANKPWKMLRTETIWE